MTATRRLAAILAADVAGYSRLIGADESSTLQALKAIRAELIDPTIAAHNGRLVKTTGDGLLVEFCSVVDALRSATEIQAGMAERNILVPKTSGSSSERVSTSATPEFCADVSASRGMLCPYGAVRQRARRYRTAAVNCITSGRSRPWSLASCPMELQAGQPDGAFEGNSRILRRAELTKLQYSGC